MSTPASIRHNNPGAMYPGPSATKFGSTKADIIGGGHSIATFPDPVHGAAALFDLLMRVYSKLTVSRAIKKWSGNNHVKAYLTHLRKAGFNSRTRVSSILKSRDDAVHFAKAMAHHEAGKPFPLSTASWRAAYDMARGKNPPKTKGLDRAQALWFRGWCPVLPGKVADIHHTSCVEDGLEQAARYLQEAVGVPIDGELGPQTLHAAMTANPARLAKEYVQVRDYYKSKRKTKDSDMTIKTRVAVEAAKQDKPVVQQPRPKFVLFSKTAWGGIIGTLATVLPIVLSFYGIKITSNDIVLIGNEAYDVMQQVGSFVGLIMVMHGRKNATRPITFKYREAAPLYSYDNPNYQNG